MKLVFMGKPGSGKGTQAKIIAKKLNIPHISTGDLFREATGKLGELVHSYIDKGNFVPDDITIKVLKERIAKEDCKNGFVLDGFPRTLPQAEALENLIKIDHYVNIYVSDDDAIKRMKGRRNCKKCNAMYNLYTSPTPKNEKRCDVCRGELYEREDQKGDAIEQRIKIHYKEVEPILEKYKPIKVNGSKSIEEVTESILEVLK